jgi:hypothetical protein
MDVPSDHVYAVLLVELVEYRDTPLATTSGLIRPSSAGPQALKEVITTSLGCV